ncbi:hypothetical protein KFE25_011782 [Diacronema lutheri]|uniref:Uncharacterized protein n=1 Tax=Diacronema lutheri TaxID=2081491 RepID=A0A8J5X7Q8_DIALT|nr:hypothetical protein KFE25_011782 [Diacronema lutheri]
MGKQLPYLRATDRELQGKALSSTVGVASSVFTLFILTTYATTNTATADWAFYLLQLHTMAFPLVAMVLIVEMKIEYVFREWMYYRLLDEGVLLDFEDEETLLQFLRTSWIG